MKLSRLIIILVLVGVAGLIIYRFATSGGEEKAASIEDIRRSEGIAVDVVTAKTATFERWRKFIGNLEGIKQSPIYASAPMRVRNILAKQGDRVGAGRALIVLDPLSSPQSYSALQGARLQYDNLKREFNRLKPLHEAGAISDSQFDQIKTQLEAAEAGLRDVQASLTLSSPISGTLTDMRVREGEKVDPGATLAVVADMSKANIKLEVSQSDMEELAVGQPAKVIHRDGSEGGAGKVHRISLSADEQSRLFLVDVMLEENGHLRAGTLQTVLVRTIYQENALTIPLAALVKVGNEMFVYVVTAESKAEKRPVVMAAGNETSLWITEGLNDGDQVVVWGMNLLAGGEKVKIHKHVDAE